MAGTRFYNRDPDAPRPSVQTLGVTALIEREGKLLLERRRDTGQWNPPGGRVEIDESFEQALRKQVLEETGLTIARFSLFGTFSDPSRIGEFADGAVIRSDDDSAAPRANEVHEADLPIDLLSPMF